MTEKRPRRSRPPRLTLVNSPTHTPVETSPPMPSKKPPPALETPATVGPGRAPSKKAPAKAGRSLPIVNAAIPTGSDAGLEDTALSAAWPEAVLALSDDERQRRVRKGLDTVLLNEVGEGGKRRTRGFVRAVLRVPLDHPKARVYGVFVELDRDAYLALQKAFTTKEEARVEGRLATRLPFLDDAYGTGVVLVEDGSDRRARIVEVASESLRTGPQIGPRVRRS